MTMDLFKRTLSFRIKRKDEPVCSDKKHCGEKLSPWEDDERAVRLGLCRFRVKYLGYVEVEESRGMHLCEQAIRSLLNNKAKHVKVFLHISGDALRVTDETNKALILDQTIDKVSFCAPDRHCRKAFAYICRDGASRRWLCHGFLGRQEMGDRLSHAIGCAFQICVEKKVRTDPKNTENVSSARVGSFRRTSLIERMIDPQSGIIAEPIRSRSTFSSNQENLSNERPRPRGIFSTRSHILRPMDLNQNTIGVFKRSNFSFKSDGFSENGSSIHSIVSIPEEESSSCSPTSLSDAWHSNLMALSQSNRPLNPFSPYAYSLATQAESRKTPNPFNCL